MNPLSRWALPRASCKQECRNNLQIYSVKRWTRWFEKHNIVFQFSLIVDIATYLGHAPFQDIQVKWSWRDILYKYRCLYANNVNIGEKMEMEEYQQAARPVVPKICSEFPREKTWIQLLNYLTKIVIKPLNPKKLWNIELTIIAPWSSFIMCLNFCT